jgi:glycerol-3-phosphate acyltransferase PlsY
MGFTFPVVAWWRMKSQHYGSEVLWGTIALAFLILARHRSNIARMLAGTEPRVGRRRPSDQSHGV